MFFCGILKICVYVFSFFFQAEDGIRDLTVTGVRRVLFRSEGGAVLTRDTALTVTGTTVARNSSSTSNGGSFGEGGALEVGDGSLAVVNSTITNNSASGAAGSGGGGIVVFNGAFEATNATIASNSAAGPGSVGGNLFLSATATTTFK